LRKKKKLTVNIRGENTNKNQTKW